MHTDDPIIQEILKNRQQMTDVAPEYEEERLNRLSSMIKHSKHYKLRKVQLANEASVEDPEKEHENDQEFASTSTTQSNNSQKSVAFSEIVTYHIYDPEEPRPTKLAEKIKTFFQKLYNKKKN